MQAITEYLCTIVKQAADLAKQPFQIYDKDEDGDVVTDADRQIEQFLVSKLRQKFPDFTFVSEEFNAGQVLTTNCFVIDPIDGTKNYAAGIPLWGIQLVMIMNAQTVASVIYLPALNELYCADQSGAYLNGKNLIIVPPQNDHFSIYDIEGGNKLAALAKLSTAVKGNFRYLSSAAVAFAWVAAGRLDGVIFRKNYVWDYLPGLYLVRAAGGFVQDRTGAHIATTNKNLLKQLSKLAVQ